LWYGNPLPYTEQQQALKASVEWYGREHLGSCTNGEKVFYAYFAAMLSKAQVKDIRSLTQYKSRMEQGAYIVEGDKMAREWLAAGAPVKIIVAVKDWLAQNEPLISRHANAQIITVSEDELTRVSALQTPNAVLLVIHLPKEEKALPVNEWCLALDRLQDPGNMGTIIRIADWYGIRHIIASPDSVDFYNPKVLQSAMGGHLRVRLHQADLPSFLQKTSMPVLAAALDGQNIYEFEKPDAAVLLIGNESKGISPDLLKMATSRVTIPRIGEAESLNAAVATGILCALLLPH
jgi:TrmH family RNA methyltransferase